MRSDASCLCSLTHWLFPHDSLRLTYALNVDGGGREVAEQVVLAAGAGGSGDATVLAVLIRAWLDPGVIKLDLCKLVDSGAEQVSPVCDVPVLDSLYACPVPVLQVRDDDADVRLASLKVGAGGVRRGNDMCV